MSSPVPEGWKESSIKNVLQQEKKKLEMHDDDSYPLLSVRRRNGGFFHRETRKGKEILTKTLTKAIPDSFVISKMQVVHGACGLIEKPFYDGYLSASYVSFLAKNGCLDLRYFNFLCQMPFMYNLFLLSSHGVHIEKMTFDVNDWLRKKIILPPLPEQQKIAAILSTVDDVIEKTRAQIDKLKDLKTGMMQELLTKGIGHTEFKDSPVGRIPVGWDVVELSTVTKVIDCKHATPKYFDSGYPVVKPGNIREGNIDLSECSLTDKAGFDNLNENHKPVKGDTIYSRNQTYGIGAFVQGDLDFAIGQDVCVIHPINCDPKYIYFTVNAPVVRDQVELLAAGSTFKRINLGDIRRLLVPVPSRSEQVNIASALSSVDSKIELHTLRLGKLAAKKKALMQDLLTGTVRVKVDNKESAVA